MTGISVQSTAKASLCRESEIVYLARTSVAVKARSIEAAQRDARLGCTTVSELLSHVDRCLCNKLTLKAVSKRVGLSRAVFARTFKYFVGLPFHRYLMLRRIDVSKQLLLYTDFSLEFVSEETGFCSKAHFGSVFQDLVGNSPARFREQSRKGSLGRDTPSQNSCRLDKTILGRVNEGRTWLDTDKDSRSEW